MEVMDEIIDSLIDENTKWWKVAKIRSLFNPNIREEILKIIICAPLTIKTNLDSRGK